MGETLTPHIEEGMITKDIDAGNAILIYVEHATIFSIMNRQ
jgi:hypothetical protein